MGFLDGLQATWNDFIFAVKNTWEGATMSPEELEKANEAFDDYDLSKDLKDTGQEMAKDLGSEAGEQILKGIPSWVLIVVAAVFAFVVFDN